VILLALLPTYEPVPQTTSALDPGHRSQPRAVHSAPGGLAAVRAGADATAALVSNDSGSWRQRYADQPVRLTLSCHRKDHEPWTVPVKIVVEDAAKS
jgi:hypothetical protein